MHSRFIFSADFQIFFKNFILIYFNQLVVVVLFCFYSTLSHWISLPIKTLDDRHSYKQENPLEFLTRPTAANQPPLGPHTEFKHFIMREKLPNIMGETIQSLIVIL